MIFINIFDDIALQQLMLIVHAEIKVFNGFYGYISYNSIQYFETIKLKAEKAASEIPDLQFSFFQIYYCN